MDRITEEQLYNKLKRHDWSFNFSDDPRMFLNGEKSLKDLIATLSVVKRNQPELLPVVKRFYDEVVTDEIKKCFKGSAGFYSVLEKFFN